VQLFYFLVGLNFSLLPASWFHQMSSGLEWRDVDSTVFRIALLVFAACGTAGIFLLASSWEA
jgi:hypothetical protein